MRIDKDRFRGAIKKHTQTRIAEKMGISQSALSQKLRHIERLRFVEFYEICEIMGEPPERFLILEQGKLEGNAAPVAA